MGLADEIEASRDLLYRRATAVCSMGVILGYLGDDDRKALEALFGDKRVFGTSIAELLNSWGPKVAETAAKEKNADARQALEHLGALCSKVRNGTVQRHRQGKCMCGRES